jgi:hypothetical protein
MQTSHKFSRPIFALIAFAILSTIALAQSNVQVSDQKAGSVLVFSYYISSSGNVRSNTRISITNVANVANTPANLTRVHLFLLSGVDCTPADLFICLTPNATAAFTTLDYDPDNVGYIIAVAVDANGLPTQNNVLIGNAFVSENTNSVVGFYEGNYGAEAFWRVPGTTPDNGNGTATIRWGTDYDGVPSQFAVEIQSPADSIGQRIYTAGLNGNLALTGLSGCAQLGTGQAYNEDEKFGSFQGFITGACLCRSGFVLTNAPRVPGGLLGLIPSGKSGILKFNVTAAVGLIFTPRNNLNANSWNGIRTLHKTATATPAGAGGPSLIVPVFPPVC